MILCSEARCSHQVKAPGAHEARALVEGEDRQVKKGSAVLPLTAKAMESDGPGVLVLLAYMIMGTLLTTLCLCFCFHCKLANDNAIMYVT